MATIELEALGKIYPGAQVQVDVTWQCLGRLDKDYTVFVQARDPANQIRGQQDTQPRAGKSPTSRWLPGQIITDTYVINMDPAAPEADYSLAIGFYDWQSGARLPARFSLGPLLDPLGNEYDLLAPTRSTGGDSDD